MGFASRVTSFMDFSNTFTFGHLKRWKAASMLMELDMFPNIMETDQRFLSWLNGCLRMEGFRDGEIKKIRDYLKDDIGINMQSMKEVQYEKERSCDQAKSLS